MRKRIYDECMSRGPAYSPEVGGVSLELHCVACRLQGSSKTRLDRVAWRPGLRVPMLGPSLTYEEGPEGQGKVKARCGKGHRPQKRWGPLQRELAEMISNHIVERQLWI